MGIIVGLLMLGSLIFIHEAGHFLGARSAGIQVIEFALGFGPKLLTHKGKDTLFSLRPIPLGGFCKLKQKGVGGYEEASWHQKARVIIMGPIANLVTGFIVFTLVYFSIVGLPVLDRAKVGRVIPKTAATELGIQPGDTIVKINEYDIETWPDIKDTLTKKTKQADELSIVIRRNNEEITLSHPHKTPVLGIQPAYEKFALLPSLKHGLEDTKETICTVISTLPQLVTNKNIAVSGPVGIIRMINEAFYESLYIYYLFAIISINLGIMNLLPIPALDGGRLVFILLESLRGGAIDSKKQALIHVFGFLFLIIVMAIVTYHDIVGLATMLP